MYVPFYKSHFNDEKRMKFSEQILWLALDRASGCVKIALIASWD